MTAQPRISVVLPTYNRAALLPRAVAGVLNQTHRNLELIVVDDASSDDTPVVLRRIDDDRLTVIRLDHNAGAPAARNRGIEAARGEFVAFQDSDDDWHPEKLERQLRALQNASDRAGLCVCSMKVHRGKETYHVRWRDQELDCTAAQRRIAGGSGLGTPCWLARREALGGREHFDETLPRMQDYEYALRITAECHLVLMSDVLVTAELQPDSQSASADRYADAIDYICTRHADLFARHPAGHSHMIFRAGKVLALEGRYREARPWFRRAVGIRPTNFSALAGLVLCSTGLFGLFKRIKYRR